MTTVDAATVGAPAEPAVPQSRHRLSKAEASEESQRGRAAADEPSAPPRRSDPRPGPELPRCSRRFTGPDVAAAARAAGHPPGVLFGLGKAREVLRARIHTLMGEVEAHRVAGDHDRALTVLKKVEGLHPGPPRVELGEVRARLLSEADRLPEAATILAWVMANCRPDSGRELAARRRYADVQLTLGDRDAAAGQWVPALEAYSRATEHQPDAVPDDRNVLWRCFRGKLLSIRALDKLATYFEAAEAVLGHSAKLGPLMRTTFPLSGVRCLGCTFDLTLARAVELLRERAALHLRVNNMAGAVADADVATRLDPTNHKTHRLTADITARLTTEFAAAKAEYDRGDYPVAARRCQSLVEAQPLDFHMTTLLGQSLLKQGAARAAVTALADALDIAVEHADGDGGGDTAMARASATVQTAKYRLAVAMHQLAISCSVIDAIALLTEAIWLNGDDPEFFVARARCHAAAGDSHNAINDFRDALFLEPGNTVAAVELSALLSERVLQAFDEGQLFEAALALGTALKYNPESPALHTALAVVKSYLGDAAAALEEAELAVKLGPSNPDAVATATRLRLEGTIATTARFDPPGYTMPLPPIKTEPNEKGTA